MLPQIEVSAESRILLSDIADYFAIVCHVLEHSLLYYFVHVSLLVHTPGSDLHITLAVHELRHQAISCFSDTNHILGFESVPWTILVN